MVHSKPWMNLKTIALSESQKSYTLYNFFPMNSKISKYSLLGQVCAFGTRGNFWGDRNILSRLCVGYTDVLIL